VWEEIRITPTKWSCSPMGDLGGGFWVVAKYAARCNPRPATPGACTSRISWNKRGYRRLAMPSPVPQPQRSICRSLWRFAVGAWLFDFSDGCALELVRQPNLDSTKQTELTRPQPASLPLRPQLRGRARLSFRTVGSHTAVMRLLCQPSITLVPPEHHSAPRMTRPGMPHHSGRR
jgi:hypothetical protein